MRDKRTPKDICREAKDEWHKYDDWGDLHDWLDKDDWDVWDD